MVSGITPVRRLAESGWWLFSTILRHDDDGEHYLVTPVEKFGWGKKTPFVATLMQVMGIGRDQVLRLKPMCMTSPCRGRTRVAHELTPTTKPRLPIFTARALSPYQPCSVLRSCGFGRNGRRPVLGVERKCFPDCCRRCCLAGGCRSPITNAFVKLLC